MSVDAETRAERVRMALAEAGYPGADVYVRGNNVHYWPETVPDDAAWRASILVDPSSCSCLACHLQDVVGYRRSGRCLAMGARSLDCGADRSDW